MLTVKIDGREPLEVKTYLQKHFKGKVAFEVVTLPEGDFSTEHCIVERKKISDLHSSILDGRLKQQCCRMSLHGTQHPVIVVHGNLTEYSKEQRVKRKVIVNERMISSALAEVKCRYNIMIIWVEDLHSMLNIMVGLMQDIEDGKYGQPATCKPEQLIARLFNITVKQYAELTELVGTLNDIGKSNVTQLMRVKGIGEVKAKHILDLMKGVKEEKNVKRRIRGKV